MHICMLVKAMPAHSKGGLQDIVNMYSEGLAKSGQRITIITTQHPKGVEIEDLGARRIHYLKGCRSVDYSREWWRKSLRKVIEVNRNDKIDIIHSQSIAAYSVLKNRAKYSLNVPVAITMHGTFYDEIITKYNVGISLIDLKESIYIVGGILKQLINFVMNEYPANRLADIVIATSNEQVGIIKKLYGLNNNKIALIYNGIEVNAFHENSSEAVLNDIRVKNGVLEKDEMIFCMARLNKEKGIQCIISAMPDILIKYPNCKLIIAGEGRYKNNLIRLAQKRNIVKNVKFIGQITFDEVAEYLNAADIFVNPTIRQNGYDLSILEAMSCGTPTIATKLGSIPTVIVDGENGFLFKYKDVKDLAGKVVHVLDNRNSEVMKNINMKATATIKNKFSVDKMVENTLVLYSKMMGLK